MTTEQIQKTFPHTCVGYDCAICWYVDGRLAEKLARREAVLRRLNRLIVHSRDRRVKLDPARNQSQEFTS